ncbi:hypothetical protein PIB30_050858 [Stylosanthes scabra]|uniref:Uncharacterized protein n=1 Tax=Stylosanthes scabra TaxID=79078 RepID=A0ABU6QH75_9FABA|nr:hypothetical protein [Stylosanthes scabra]
MLGSATVSLGRDDSGNLIVDGPPITASQPAIQYQLHPEEEVINIFSSSEDKHEPTPNRVFFPLIPKAEKEQPQQEEQPPQHPQEEENPPPDEEQDLEAEGRPTQTQSIVEVIPIYPTQEVIDISSSSDVENEPTPIQVLIPKAEVDLVSSPHKKSITDVLLSMSQEHPTHFEPDDAPSFNLGVHYGTEPHQTQEERLLTTQAIPEIEESDELIREKGDQFQTFQPTQSLNIRNELHDRVAIWATVPLEGNEFENIFKLSGHRFLEAMKYQFMSMRQRTYIDIQVVSIMCHTLNMKENEWFQKQVYCVPPEILNARNSWSQLDGQEEKEST